MRGRKVSPESSLGDAKPPFKLEVIELAARRQLGVVHLPARTNMERNMEKTRHGAASRQASDGREEDDRPSPY